MEPSIWQYVIDAVIGAIGTVAAAVLVNRLNKIQSTVDGTNTALRMALEQSKAETLAVVQEALRVERKRDPKP